MSYKHKAESKLSDCRLTVCLHCRSCPHGGPCHHSGLWLAGNEGMEKKVETTIMGYIGIGFRNGKEKGNYYNELYLLP